MGLSLVEGRLSEKYNHFSEFEFVSCQATDTRLMGVVAMKMTWRGKNNPRAHFYQVLHLDYSEYGIDEYREFDCIPGTDNYKDNKDDMVYCWRHFTSVMGGSIVTITPNIMLRLIDMALPLAGDDIDREYDNEENAAFRHRAKQRLAIMKEELAGRGITAETCDEDTAMRAVCLRKLGTCAVINYFIMRLVDRDFDAASLLSTIDRKSLESNELTDAGVQTLIKSSIKRSNKTKDPPADGTSYPYRCKITTLGRSGYYHATFVIYLNGDFRARDSLVTQLEIGSVVKLSDYETAIQIARNEYITVFKCTDRILNGFDGRYIEPLASADQTMVPNGWLYTIYNKDNSHVNKAEYRLGDDVYGYALLTIGGQFVLMSTEVTKIGVLDDAAITSFYSSDMSVVGRYVIDTPVFHTMCHTPGLYFEDLIEPET